jgi:hypothetical protein
MSPTTQKIKVFFKRRQSENKLPPPPNNVRRGLPGRPAKLRCGMVGNHHAGPSSGCWRGPALTLLMLQFSSISRPEVLFFSALFWSEREK